ncbi:MAG: hydroxymethylglutaryl-CoA lyase [Thermodesulfobacteriota bacterium]
MTAVSTIHIREVAPRDGFQSWPEFVPTESKLEVILALIQAGLREMEATSFVSPKLIPQMRDAAEVMKAVPRTGCRYAALVPNLKGARMAVEAGADELVVVISASEKHNLANVRRTIAESLADLKSIFPLAAGAGTPVAGALAVSFGCPYQGDVPVEDVFRLADAYLSGGASSLILADTTGMATPPRVQRLLEAFLGRFQGTRFSLHFHNNRGTAMANLYAALDAGADTFDTALGGIGGCPNVPQAAGNLPTEDVVYLLEDMGYETGINLMKIIEAAHLLERILGRALPGQVMKSGPRNPELAARVCGLGHAV